MFKRANRTFDLVNNILRVFYILVILIIIYVALALLKGLGIFNIISTTFKVLTPFFIGLVIAWLFNPIVLWLEKKKFSRSYAVITVYLCFIGLLFLMILAIIPQITHQIEDLGSSIPNILDKLSDWTENIFNSLSSSKLNLSNIKNDISIYLNNVGEKMIDGLPNKAMKIITTILSGLGIIVLGLVFGFYILFHFDKVKSNLISLFPKKTRKDIKILCTEINSALISFVHGTLLISFIIFIVNYIGFLFIGVEAPLLFAAFCGITNIIPYIGPLIGGIPVVLVGLSHDITIGIFVFVYVFVIQFLESTFLQPVVMGKTTELSPVTILVGLLVFGYFFGIIGMMFATPIISVLKTVFIYFDRKYNLTKYQEE